MALFQMKWLRRLVRSYTNPIEQDSAALWKRRLSLAYMLLAWNAFGFVCYMVYSGRGDWAKYHGVVSKEEASLRPSQYYAKIMNIQNAKVIRIGGGDIPAEDKVNDIEE